MFSSVFALSLWRPDAAGAFVPSFGAQPLLERLKLNLGVFAPRFQDVCLEARLVEPAEHLVELLAEEKANHRHGELLEFHGLAQNSTEDLLRSDELFGAVECQRYKRADVVAGDGLIGFVCANGIHELAFQNPEFDLVDVVVLHQGRGPDLTAARSQP